MFHGFRLTQQLLISEAQVAPDDVTAAVESGNLESSEPGDLANVVTEQSTTTVSAECEDHTGKETKEQLVPQEASIADHAAIPISADDGPIIAQDDLNKMQENTVAHPSTPEVASSDIEARLDLVGESIAKAPGDQPTLVLNDAVEIPSGDVQVGLADEVSIDSPAREAIDAVSQVVGSVEEQLPVPTKEEGEQVGQTELTITVGTTEEDAVKVAPISLSENTEEQSAHAETNEGHAADAIEDNATDTVTELNGSVIMTEETVTYAHPPQEFLADGETVAQGIEPGSKFEDFEGKP